MVQSFHITRVAITKRISQRRALRTQAHIVHSPAIHADRRDSFRRKLRAGAQAVVHTFADVANIPAKIVSHMPSRVRKAMDQPDLWLSIGPLQQGNPATLGT